MGRSWRWVAGDGDDWKIERSLRWEGIEDGEELEGAGRNWRWGRVED
jgi:hypothetical protein